MLINLENIYQHESSCPLIFIDLRVQMHRILGLYNPSVEHVFREWCRCNWVIALHGQLTSLPPPEIGYRAVLGDDLRDTKTFKYWRSDLLPGYKSNRAAEEERGVQNRIMDVLYQEFSNEFEIHSEESFECDDIAGALCKLKLEHQDERSLFLITLDSDWMQLVDDSTSVMFWNVLDVLPRLRKEPEVLSWLFENNWPGINPRSIIDMKKAWGDQSDCIPANTPDAEDVIDLLYPAQTLNCDTIKKLQSELVDFNPNVNRSLAQKSYDWLKLQNLPILSV